MITSIDWACTPTLWCWSCYLQSCQKMGQSKWLAACHWLSWQQSHAPKGGKSSESLVSILRCTFFLPCVLSVPFESFHAGPVKEPFKLSKMKPKWMAWHFVWSCLTVSRFWIEGPGLPARKVDILQTSYVGLIVWLVAHDHKPWCANEHFLRAAQVVYRRSLVSEEECLAKAWLLRLAESEGGTFYWEATWRRDSGWSRLFLRMYRGS